MYFHQRPIQFPVAHSRYAIKKFALLDEEGVVLGVLEMKQQASLPNSMRLVAVADEEFENFVPTTKKRKIYEEVEANIIYVPIGNETPVKKLKVSCEYEDIFLTPTSDLVQYNPSSTSSKTSLYNYQSIMKSFLKSSLQMFPTVNPLYYLQAILPQPKFSSKVLPSCTDEKPAATSWCCICPKSSIDLSIESDCNLVGCGLDTCDQSPKCLSRNTSLSNELDQIPVARLSNDHIFDLERCGLKCNNPHPTFNFQNTPVQNGFDHMPEERSWCRLDSSDVLIDLNVTKELEPSRITDNRSEEEDSKGYNRKGSKKQRKLKNRIGKFFRRLFCC